MTQSIGEFVRDNGGYAWEALENAVQALEAAEADRDEWRKLYLDALARELGQQAHAEAAERERDNVISLYQASVREGVLVEAIADTLRAEDRLEAAEADRARLLAANAMLAADLGAAERDAAKWREMHDDRDRDLQHEYARANATEAEVTLLREALTEALDELRKTQQDMADWYEFGPPTNLAKTQKTRLSDEVASTKAEVARLAALEAKSREHADALAARARELLAENGELVQEVARLRAALNLIDEARANALAECERLRAVLADIAEATNVDDPESYRCDDQPLG